MVSANFAATSAARQNAHYGNGLSHHNQSQSQLVNSNKLDQLFDFLSSSANDQEWPSLGNSSNSNIQSNQSQFSNMFGGGLFSNDRARPIGRRPTLGNMGQQQHHHQQQQQPQQQPQRQPSMVRMHQDMSVSPPNGVASQQQQNNAAPKNPKLYKTELCRSWMDSGRCNYGERCQYAHGESEKRPIPRHPKYKTEACQSYHQSGYCPYGPRCHFIHNEEPHILSQMVAANAAATAATKHQQQQTIQQQQIITPTRPTNLFAASSPSNVPLTSFNHQQQQGATSGLNTSSNATAIAAAAAVAAAAYNQQPQLFSRQFQSQLQRVVVGTKPASSSGTAPNYNHQDCMGSTGDSPIPSSNDSGTESPMGSFSPGVELDEPFYGRAGAVGKPKLLPQQQQQQVQQTRMQQPPHLQASLEWSLAREFAALNVLAPQNELSPTSDPNNGPLNLLPSSLSSDVESGFLSSASSTSSNLGSKSLGSPIVGSPPHQQVSTPTAGRLPVFERLSNGP